MNCCCGGGGGGVHPHRLDSLQKKALRFMTNNTRLALTTSLLIKHGLLNYGGLIFIFFSLILRNYFFCFIKLCKYVYKCTFYKPVI